MTSTHPRARLVCYEPCDTTSVSGVLSPATPCLSPSMQTGTPSAIRSRLASATLDDFFGL